MNPVRGGGGPSGSVLSTLGRALRHRNYRLFFSGQSISLIGTWLTRVATGWLVYRLTHSAFALGVVGFVGQLPTFLLAPFAGVWVDRLNRHRVLVVTQALAAAQSAALAALTLGGLITIRDILLLSAFQGVINAVDMPARQSFVVEMVEDRADLPNAIALNSSMFNGARLVGPSLAGLLIAWVGEGWCFLADAVSYLAVIASLLAMRVPLRAGLRTVGRVLHELREGFQYVAGFTPIRSVLLLLALSGLFGMPYTVLLPIFAGQVLHGGPHTLGFLMAASGLGALLGALYLASRRSVLGLGRLIAAMSGLFGLGLIAFSRSPWLLLSLPLMALVGMSMMVQMASSNTILQTIVDEDKRGRVMSYYAMAFFGSAPLGSFFAGSLASRIGAPDTILCGGVACLISAGVFYRHLPALRRAVLPVYRRLGILPGVGPGEPAAPPVVPPEE
ncbi:MAG TPA: MFS transporter [Candidatus Eisenbacteria bacterium]|jgi:MFS family permease